jgi:hypothetical protein
MEREKREKIVKVRFSDAEYDELVRIALAKGERQLSRFVRNAILSQSQSATERQQTETVQPQLQRERGERDSLALQVRRIGVNINQIARSLNANSSLSVSDKLKLLAALESLRLAVEDLNSKGRQ